MTDDAQPPSKKQRVQDFPPESESNKTNVASVEGLDAAATSADTLPKLTNTVTLTSEDVGDVPTDRSPLDLAETINLQSQARIEVMWDLEDEISKDAENSVSPFVPQQQPTKQTRWWGATLLPLDGDKTNARTHLLEDSNDPGADSCLMVVRELLYDPYPAGGYPNPSVSNVVFVSDHLVYDLDVENTCVFRVEGNNWEPTELDLTEAPPEMSSPAPAIQPDELTFTPTPDGVTAMLDNMLTKVIDSVSTQLTSVDAARQAIVGEIMGRCRTVMAESLMRKVNDINGANQSELTGQHVAEIIEEIAPRMQQIKAEVIGNYRAGCK